MNLLIHFYIYVKIGIESFSGTHIFRLNLKTTTKLDHSRPFWTGTTFQKTDNFSQQL